mgnify:CR=1 FL=1
MSGAFGYNQSKSQQQSAQESGFGPHIREALGHQSVAESVRLAELMRQRTAPGAGPQWPGLTSTGLYEGQQQLYDTGFSQAVTQALSRFSGNEAARGFLQPNAVANIAGSAAQQVAPQFAAMAMPLAGQNILQSMLGPEQIDQSRINQYMDLIRTMLSGGTGGTGQGSGSSNAFGFNVSGGIGPSGGGGAKTG